MSLRLAAYAVCIEKGRVLLVRHVADRGESTWTLPGGKVEHAVAERLLGVDSRVIRPAERAAAGPEHQNVGIFYQVRITGGRLRPEPNGETTGPTWTPVPDVAGLRRSSL